MSIRQARPTHRVWVAVIALVWASTATSADLVAGYVREVRQQNPGFSPDSQRGSAFFKRRFAVNDKMPACTACHGDDMLKNGQHVITGKFIKAMAPAAEPSRLSDPAKVEKWFLRNCNEVVGRPCSAAEKADVAVWLMSVR